MIETTYAFATVQVNKFQEDMLWMMYSLIWRDLYRTSRRRVRYKYFLLITCWFSKNYWVHGTNTWRIFIFLEKVFMDCNANTVVPAYFLKGNERKRSSNIILSLHQKLYSVEPSESLSNGVFYREICTT